MTVDGGNNLRRYRVDHYLTEGGMGAIYLGRKLGAGGFEKEVVLKQLLPEFIDRPEFRDLFFREAKISAGLDHVNIVRTYDLVRSDDSLFIVMEYVAGTDLRTITWRARLYRKPVSVAAILHIGMEALAGLAYAHSRTDRDGLSLGIVHRDVSPSNILCSGHGDVKLSDFGIAKAAAFSSVFYRVRGKVGYMSPEQARNQPLDGRTDLYSLAICLFEALSGERLLEGDLQTPPDVIYGKPLPDLVQRRPDVPIQVQAALARALDVDPDRRFANANEFQQVLRQIAREHGLLYSAPQLAAELRDLLGPDSQKWSQEEFSTLSVGETEKMPVAEAPRGPAPGNRVPLAAPSSLLAGAPPMARSAPGTAVQHPIPTGTLETLSLTTRNLPTLMALAGRSGSAALSGPGRRRFTWWWIMMLVFAAGVAYFMIEKKP